MMDLLYFLLNLLKFRYIQAHVQGYAYNFWSSHEKERRADDEFPWLNMEGNYPMWQHLCSHFEN